MSPWIQVTSGRGGRGRGQLECACVVVQVAEAIRREGEGLGLAVAVLEAEPGPAPGTAASALLEVADEAPAAWLASWAGTVAWVGESRFRPGHKRKRWFVGVSVLAPPAATAFDPADVRFEAMPPGGPGGQHANKTASAVRATHGPTGLTAVAREARGQARNRALALARLAARLAEGDRAAAADAEAGRWAAHDGLVRGNAVRTYEGPGFRRRP